MDDRVLAQRLVDWLRARRVVTDDQLRAAAAFFEQGKLPSTALRRAGLEREVVLAALEAASGLPQAPPLRQWTSEALKLTPVAGVSWATARAVPVGVSDGVLQVAFADPKRVDGAKASLPRHVACCCLEEDLDAALRALNDNATLVGSATIGATPAPPVPAAPAPLHVEASGGAVALATPLAVGPWRIDRLIAQGGMGVVYLAEDDAGRRAAVKLVHAHLLHVPEVRLRFVREARANQKLRHPNIVSVLDVGEGTPAWLAVEFVDGGTLHELVNKAGGRLPVAAALDVLVQMLEGLVVAHAASIVHRDLKPSNLLLTREGTVKIADFGIAREVDATALTQTGSTLGTPAYMSPEQALAEPVDVRSDLYTAGVIAYMLVAGRNPFDAESLGATVTAILQGNVPSLFEVDASVPELVDELVAWLMRRDRAARPASAAEALAVARAAFDEVRGARAHPLGDVLADVRHAGAQRRDQSDAWLRRARALLQQPGQREAAALALYRAVSADPDHADARTLLDGFAAEGLVFGPPSLKLAELELELKKRPDDPVLLQRAGHLARQEGNLHMAVVHWRRSLAVRPDDAHLQTQLARLLGAGAPDVTQALSTVQRIAGHVATGGFAGASPPAPVVGLRPQPPPVVEAEPEGGAAVGLFAAHWGKLAVVALAALVVFGIVHATGKAMKHGQLAMESSYYGGGLIHDAKDADDEAMSVEDQRIADEANATGDFAAAEKRAAAGIERGADHTVLGRLFLARGKARLGEGKPLAAVEDLTQVVQGFHDDNVAYPEALLLRGAAHAKAGDGKQALADFTTCIDSRANQYTKARARYERGRVESSAGDTAAARDDLRWVTDYTSPADPMHKDALAELDRLGGG